MRCLVFAFLLISCSYNLYAQITDSAVVFNDTASLENITVTAFASEAKWKEVPASVSIISRQNLQRYDGNTLVPAMNMVPGVRMEERSPGSYRLSIRGSLLRSPFGVRNIKVYWDDVPLTDAAGNTYLQLIDVNEVDNIEIIKGPSSSYYGANTGGTVILHNQENKAYKKNVFSGILNGGSFGLFNEQVGWRIYGSKVISNLQQSHLQNDGYREQSALRRDVISWNSRWNINSKETVSFIAFYTDLHYQTPGGITKQQMDENPKLSRQPSGALPGAVTQQTGVYNKTFFAAATVHSALVKNLNNTTSLVINHTDFKNPFITNYEKRNEWNYSGRTNFYYTFQKSRFIMQANAGAEIQYNDSYISVFGNARGIPDTIQYKDKVHVTQYFLFAQVNMDIGKKLIAQAGISRNKLHYWLNETTDLSNIYPKIEKAGPTVSPRFSVLYKLNSAISLFAIAAKGFSPPTLGEIRPSTGNFNTELQPESGWNYEAGFKGTAIKNALDYNTSFYYFSLKNAIVRRTDAIGADYFVNAGSTTQKGVEIWLNGRLIQNNKGFINTLSIWNSFTYQPYRFNEYIVDTNIYSGNKITGVPSTINVTGIDIKTRKNFYTNITFNFTSSLPLNDANTAYANQYHLLQIKVGKELIFKRSKLNVFIGGDNILNEVYSLGNDINAAGSRYYNPAPDRNYFGGIRFQF